MFQSSYSLYVINLFSNEMVMNSYFFLLINKVKFLRFLLILFVCVCIISFCVFVLFVKFHY